MRCLLWFTLLFSLRASGAEIVTLLPPESGHDPRTSYSIQLIKLALDKTRPDEGEADIRFSPPMNTARALEAVRANALPNLIVMTTFENRFLDQGLDYARFPIDLGVTGYRICFVSPSARDGVARAVSLDELRQFTIGQGRGWTDIGILRHNGFKVQEVSSYESLFSMVAAGRIDLFCRGANELGPELATHQNLPGLDYDRSFALVYTLPRFFIANAKNGRILHRITLGLQMAWQDGSLRALWMNQFKEALDFAQLGKRRLFFLKTPDIDRIDFDYHQYSFDPRKLTP